MLAIYHIPVGQTVTMNQGALGNESYTLPIKTVWVTSTAAIETSLDEISWATLVNANTTGAITGAKFVRSATPLALIMCKEYATL